MPAARARRARLVALGRVAVRGRAGAAGSPPTGPATGASSRCRSPGRRGDRALGRGLSRPGSAAAPAVHAAGSRPAAAAGSSCSAIREKVTTRRAPGAPRPRARRADEDPLVGVAPARQQPAAVRRPGEAGEPALAVEQRARRALGPGRARGPPLRPGVGHGHAAPRRVHRHHPRPAPARQSAAPARGAVAAEGAHAAVAVSATSRSPRARPLELASAVRRHARARARGRRTRRG